MKVSSFLVCAAVLVSSAISVADHSETSGKQLVKALYGHHGPRKVAKAVTFHDDMRKLWMDHVIWTRGYIISVTHDLPDAGVTAGRLLENQAHIGDAFKPFYGDAAGDGLTALLREHILIAAEILAAAKAGDDDAVGDAVGRWYANGDQIADYLSALNPRHWPQDDLRMMMAEHLDTTLAEAVSRLTGDYAQDIADYEVAQGHLLMMADALSNGIIAQFPRRFR